MWFWVKYLLLVFILIVVVIYFLFGSGLVFDMKEIKNVVV